MATGPDLTERDVERPMSSGPENYAAALKLLRDSRGITADDLEPAQLLTAVLAEAQVRATLALAAATWFADPTGEVTDMGKEWWTVAGEPRSSGALPGTVWWLDDGQENPGPPRLYTTEAAARDAGVKQYRDDNFGGTREFNWLPVDDEDDEIELAVNGSRTGIVVRPVRPKDAV